MVWPQALVIAALVRSAALGLARQPSLAMASVGAGQAKAAKAGALARSQPPLLLARCEARLRMRQRPLRQRRLCLLRV